MAVSGREGISSHSVRARYVHYCLLCISRWQWHLKRAVYLSLQIMKVSLFPFEGGDQSPFAILYSTSSGLHFSSLSSAPTSVLASMADRGPTSTHITCFDCSPTTIACGTSAFGYQVYIYTIHVCWFYIYRGLEGGGGGGVRVWYSAPNSLLPRGGRFLN